MRKRRPDNILSLPIQCSRRSPQRYTNSSTENLPGLSAVRGKLTKFMQLLRHTPQPKYHIKGRNWTGVLVYLNITSPKLK